MTQLVIADNLKAELEQFLKKNKKADIITAYLFFLEIKFNIQPVLFIRDKIIYKSKDELLKKLEAEGKLWRETEIKIQFQRANVNELTTKIYICPFTGKVFGNNTHPNPQDAIYDWVAKCPENTERAGGLRVKRFFVSEDPEVIRNYITAPKEPVAKTVYSSVITGKLYNSKTSVIEDFKKNQIKTIPLVQVPSQNRFQIEEVFLQFIQDHLQEDKLSSFVEELSNHPEFSKYVEGWLEEETVADEE
ncbi:MAG: hypothetical protein K940chlam2_01100 [Chlamydiae bacterium]|nr:hypothetical protein [Chlamydiota bacterium]